jgi:C-terminal processing protease CtpA/Prc
VRGTTRDINRRAQEAGRDIRDDARDIRRDARDAASDVRSNARSTTRDLLDSTRGSVRADADVNVRGSARAFSEFRGADLGVWFDRSARDGLVIADVATDAALAQVGFREGDRIVSVNGQTITSEADFVRYLMADDLRDRVAVVVMRDGREMPLYVDPIVIRERVTHVHVDPLEQFGIIIDDRYDDRIVVWRVIPRSPAFYAGIRSR